MICNKCKGKVEREKELDYPWYCPNCDEEVGFCVNCLNCGCELQGYEITGKITFFGDGE